MNNPQHPASRLPGREHIPIYPKGFVAIRIVQLVLAVLVLGLAAYGVSEIAFDGNCFILSVALMTLISSIYHLVVRFSAPAGYNYWAILGLDILLVVMWLSSFALLAARVAPVFELGTVWYNPSTGRYTRGGLASYDLVYLSTQAAAASLGGVEFILHLVSLIIHSIRLHHHRAAGLHCMPGVPRTDKPPPGFGAMYQQPYPPPTQMQQPLPAYLQHGQHPQQKPMYLPQQGVAGYPQQQQQQQQQQFYPPGTGPMSMPMPMMMMPMPGQPQPQQHQHQQQVPQGYYVAAAAQQPSSHSPASQQQQQQ
ncbi:hypothetical protein C8A00DRAFT_13459 [Chaetomidium leptoderma]|uniref:MARVEL domain-containing protein n=1 Tax=Chaetomidium leptoderma TaxID=669021 RepID=A0AAN7A0A1_9PEZI|nr:hypothetical protein C8A00DRAFT_13459 [Chaetomidium leptoderma]